MTDTTTPKKDAPETPAEAQAVLFELSQLMDEKAGLEDRIAQARERLADLSRTNAMKQFEGFGLRFVRYSGKRTSFSKTLAKQALALAFPADVDRIAEAFQAATTEKEAETCRVEKIQEKADEE